MLMGKFYNGKFEQLTRKVYSSSEGLPDNAYSVCCFKEKFYIAGGDGLYEYAEDGIVKTADFGGKAVNGIKSSGSVLYIAADKSFYCFDGDSIKLCAEFDETAIEAVRDKDNTVWYLTEKNLYREIDGNTELLTGIPGNGRHIDAFGDNNVYLASDCGLMALTGKRWHWSELTGEWSGLVSDNVKCVRFDSIGNIWAGTDRGVCVYDGSNCWKTCDNISNLPYGDICDMFFGKDGIKYFASSTGLIIQKKGKLKYYGYKRWLPSPNVLSVAVNGKNEIAALTDGGLSVITPRTMTLEEKADIYDSMIDKYFTRKDGYMCSLRMSVAGEPETGCTHATDNDGLYTGLYVCAQSFKYAVTGKEEARKKARNSLNAMFKLVDICGDSGFVARAIRYSDESDFETGVRHEWHKINENTEWLGETSSDEITGHMLAYSVYYDLCADSGEKEKIERYVRLITDHILNNSFHLIDTDGKPTTWANWEPSLLNNDNKWIFERGINSLEILSYLISAYHITGEERYHSAFDSLVKEHHYALNVMNHKIKDAHITHIDDRLGFYCVYPLLMYADDPDLVSIIQMGLYDHWQYERIEHTPLYNAVYGYFTGDMCDIEAAAKSLEECPLDTTYWQMYNSYIKELEWDDEQEKYGNAPQLKEPLPGYIRPVCLCDGNPFLCDTGDEKYMNTNGENTGLFYNPSRKGDNGMGAMNPTIIILSYWAARHFGLLGD